VDGSEFDLWRTRCYPCQLNLFPLQIVLLLVVEVAGFVVLNRYFHVFLTKIFNLKPQSPFPLTFIVNTLCFKIVLAPFSNYFNLCPCEIDWSLENKICLNRKIGMIFGGGMGGEKFTFWDNLREWDLIGWRQLKFKLQGRLKWVDNRSRCVDLQLTFV
jgi:hypothetical protein